MDIARTILSTAAALGIALGLAACSPSSDDGGDSTTSALEGSWSGNWADTALAGNLFAHAPSGNFTIAFAESGGAVSGDISMDSDPCAVPNGPSSGTITGTLTGTALAFVYDTASTSTEQPDPALTSVSFSGEFLEATAQIKGTYDANTCAPVSNTWNGQFILNKP